MATASTSTAPRVDICSLPPWFTLVRAQKKVLLFDPLRQCFLRLEGSNLNTVDRRPRLADFADFRGRHFANPEHVMPLEAGMDEIGGFAVDSPVEIASADQHQIDQVAAEFQQQPLGAGYAGRRRLRCTETTCCRHCRKRNSRTLRCSGPR